ncbi:GGDEF domain-containing protein [Chitinasiproducens palmae]|uniref:diguanylate cyclase n=1 Tax=Chitinasiproducens palmae TaxID=1770053 RepID=A0A1H2PTN0_9BURK|nr:GGDEF domain-containing protein [Chitinasiproducens palmae]SDV50478.1 diguanylate cyclase (GGDEF) domain-containing protein [Chitinasiproducens palmae]
MRVKDVVLSWMAFPETLSLSIRQQALIEIERRAFAGVAAYPASWIIVCYAENLYHAAPLPSLAVTGWFLVIFAARLALHLKYERQVLRQIETARLAFLLLLAPGPISLGALSALSLSTDWLYPAHDSLILITAVLCAAATLNLCVDRIARILIPVLTVVPPAIFLALAPDDESPTILPLAAIFVTYLIVSSENISRDYWTLAEARQRIQDQADSNRVLSVTDHLTSIPNRLYFYQLFAEKCKAAAEAQSCFAVLLLDIDHFKQINDGLGHAAGDACLIALGAFLNRLLSPACHLFARYGGEEFIVAAQVKDAGDVARIAHEICEGISMLRVPFDDQLLNFTCSVGYTLLTPPIAEDYPDRVIASADRALYEAKRAGRNTVRGVAWQ